MYVLVFAFLTFPIVFFNAIFEIKYWQGILALLGALFTFTRIVLLLLSTSNRIPYLSTKGDKSNVGKGVGIFASVVSGIPGLSYLGGMLDELSTRPKPEDISKRYRDNFSIFIDWYSYKVTQAMTSVFFAMLWLMWLSHYRHTIADGIITSSIKAVWLLGLIIVGLFTTLITLALDLVVIIFSWFEHVFPITTQMWNFVYRDFVVSWYWHQSSDTGIILSLSIVSVLAIFIVRYLYTRIRSLLQRVETTT